MKYVLIILGLISVYASCNKSMTTLQFKSYVDGKLTNCHWRQVSGPSLVAFDHNDTSVVNVNTDKPAVGTYVIEAEFQGATFQAVINVTK